MKNFPLAGRALQGLTLAASLLTCAHVAHAQTNEWTGGYLGNWSDPANWSLGTPNNTQSGVKINSMYSTVTVDSVANIGSAMLSIATETTPSSTRTFFRVSNGANLTTGLVQLGSANLGGGNVSTGIADASVSGNGGTAVWNAGNIEASRYGGTTQLTISAGGTLNSRSVTLAERSGATATMTVSAGRWNVLDSNTVQVGGSGTAQLNIANGATVEGYSLNVNAYHYSATTTAGSGSVSVNNATLELAGELSIGGGEGAAAGASSFSVLNGGKVSTEMFGLGRSAQGGTQSVTVSGAGSRLEVTGASNVMSRGTLLVADGGVFVSERGSAGASGGMGATPRDQVTIRVTGNGSLYHTTGEAFEFGRGGDAEVIVADGGRLRVGEAGDGVIALGLHKQAPNAWNPNPPPPGVGTLRIGEGGAAGLIEAAEIRGGGSAALPSGGAASGGSAKLVINHNQAAYTLAAAITYGGNVFSPGTFSVEHNGSGTTTLNASNSYNGGTTVNAGTLLINGSAAYRSDEFGSTLIASGTGTGAIEVGAGARLGGRGEIGGDALINGTLLASEATGSLTFLNGLTLGDGSTVRLTLAPGGAGFESIQISGLLSVESRIVLDLQGFSHSQQDFDVKIFDHLTNDALDYTLHFTYTEGGLSITQSGLNGANLDIAVIPEPGSVALLALTGLGLGWHTLRRRRQTQA